MHCRLCGKSNLYLYYTEGNDNQFKYYKCRYCNLVNYDLSSGLDQEQFTEKYISPKDETNKSNKDQTQTYNFLKKHLKKPGRMIDIGCLNARILFLAKLDGWEVKGLDLSMYFAGRVQEEVGIDIEVVNFLEYQVDQTNRFDVVIMRHVLEHLPDSILALNKINSLMKDDGFALLEFPNVEGHSNKFKRFLSKTGIRKKKYPPNWKPGHCNQFCKESFKFLLSQTGFVMEDWHTYSSHRTADLIYQKIHIGNKARALIRT